MNNTFGWVTLKSTDPKKAKDFYGELFHWSLTEKECNGAPYIEIDAGEGPCAGIMKSDREASHWTPFVNVSNIHKSTEKAEKLGARIVVPIMDLGGNEGFISVFIDPAGAVLGLYAPR